MSLYIDSSTFEQTTNVTVVSCQVHCAAVCTGVQARVIEYRSMTDSVTLVDTHLTGACSYFPSLLLGLICHETALTCPGWGPAILTQLANYIM